MALTTRSAGQSPIDSSAVNQYYNVLTGVMTDQPITFANTLTVTGGTMTVSSHIQGNDNIYSNAIITGQAGSSSPVGGGLPAFRLGNVGPELFWGTGAPNMFAVPGSLYIRVDASSTTRMYICTSSASSTTGWATVTTSS